MLEVSFEQISAAVGTIVVSLVTAITFLTKWILSTVDGLKTKLESCEVKHAERDLQVQCLIEKSAKLEGRVEEMERMNPTELVAQITKVIKDHVNDKQAN